MTNRLTKEQLETYKNTYDHFDGIAGNEFDAICDELIGYKQLEEQVGCPLEVYVKIRQSMIENVYIQRFKMEKCRIMPCITSNGFCANGGLLEQACFWKDYKKTWWLKEDKSE